MKEKLEKAKNWVKDHKWDIAEGVLFVGGALSAYFFGYGWRSHVVLRAYEEWDAKITEGAKTLPPFETGNPVAFATEGIEKKYSGAMDIRDVDIGNLGKFGSEIAEKLGAGEKCDVTVYYSKK